MTGLWKVENVGGIELVKREYLEKNSKIPTLHTTIEESNERRSYATNELLLFSVFSCHLALRGHIQELENSWSRVIRSCSTWF